MHAANAALSSRHWSVTDGSACANEKVADVDVVLPAGAAVIDGAASVILHERVAVPLAPLALTARTRNVCEAYVSPEYVMPLAQAAKAALSSRHWKVAPAVALVNVNTAVRVVAVPDGPPVIVGVRGTARRAETTRVSLPGTRVSAGRPEAIGPKTEDRNVAPLRAAAQAVTWTFVGRSCPRLAGWLAGSKRTGGRPGPSISPVLLLPSCPADAIPAPTTSEAASADAAMRQKRRPWMVRM